jgi:hypothetical protein
MARAETGLVVVVTAYFLLEYLRAEVVGAISELGVLARLARLARLVVLEPGVVLEAVVVQTRLPAAQEALGVLVQSLFPHRHSSVVVVVEELPTLAQVVTVALLVIVFTVAAVAQERPLHSRPAPELEAVRLVALERIQAAMQLRILVAVEVELVVQRPLRTVALEPLDMFCSRGRKEYGINLESSLDRAAI